MLKEIYFRQFSLAQVRSLHVKTVLFQTIPFQNSAILSNLV